MSLFVPEMLFLRKSKIILLTKKFSFLKNWDGDSILNHLKKLWPMEPTMDNCDEFYIDILGL